ncbi:MAG: hypothetical protein Q8P47_02755 [Candidatus Beckwithbacteria bacterium]|nr:hypothetical protein [Candidatus Beckwithbacteria bacterium]
MAVEARERLIQTGYRLAAVPEKIYGLPVVFDGDFEPAAVTVPLNDVMSLQALVPEFINRQEYQPQTATCILVDGKPLVALVSGIHLNRWLAKNPKTDEEKIMAGEIPVTSIVNLTAEPEKVNIAIPGIKISQLKNIGSFWPGYNLAEREPELKAGQKKILVAQGFPGTFTISFVRPRF